MRYDAAQAALLAHLGMPCANDASQGHPSLFTIRQSPLLIHVLAAVDGDVRARYESGFLGA
jgi:hypothetical protein